MTGPRYYWVSGVWAFESLSLGSQSLLGLLVWPSSFLSALHPQLHLLVKRSVYYPVHWGESALWISISPTFQRQEPSPETTLPAPDTHMHHYHHQITNTLSMHTDLGSHTLLPLPIRHAYAHHYHLHRASRDPLRAPNLGLCSAHALPPPFTLVSSYWAPTFNSLLQCHLRG